jgi:SAM-dependent methyltransferase
MSDAAESATENSAGERFDFYAAQYARFAGALAREMRREVYGVDLGQQGWRTVDEQEAIPDLLRLGPKTHLLDIACGSGGPSLALVERTGCRLTGIDVEAAAIAYAKARAEERGLAGVAFMAADCAGRLPFADGAFAAILCIDAISHLPDRFAVLREWTRLLAPGGRLMFADPLVLTGPLAADELAIRASLGFYLLVPPGLNEQAIAAAGLRLLHREDRTAAAAGVAARWHQARADRAEQLVGEEGEAFFARRQRFLATTAELAGSGRLSRFLYAAEKPA